MVGTWALGYLGTWALGHLGTWALLGQALDAGMGAAADGKRVNDTLCVSDIIITAGKASPNHYYDHDRFSR